MAQIIRKTEATYPGPWLLDNAALTALDEIIDEQWLRLVAHKKRQIESVKRPGDDSRPHEGEHESDIGDGRTITLALSSGNKIRVNSFREAASDVHCQGQKVTKVEVRFYCGGIRGDLVVPSPKSEALSLVTLPEGSDAADELFVRLNTWAEQYRPDWFRQIRGWGVLPIWIVWFGLVMVLLMGGVVTGVIWETNTWNSEVRELLSQGVRAEDHSRALELLLQKAVGLDQLRGTIHFPSWFRVTAFFLAIVASFLSIRARTVFEIGTGTPSVRRQQRYDWLLRRAIPTFLIMGVLASTLGSFAYEFLRSK